MAKLLTVGRPPKSSQRLTKQLILQTALPIVREQGADALTFRVLADRLKVTPMAVTYHTGSKHELLADLVGLAFQNTLKDVSGGCPKTKARRILSAYFRRAVLNANLLRAILADVSLLSGDLIEISNELRACTQQLDQGDQNDVLLHLLIDYTHGFVLAASSGERNRLTSDDFLRGVDWVLARVTGDAIGQTR